MKKAGVIVVVVLFFILVLGAVLFKIFAPSEQATIQTTAVSFPTATAPVGADIQDPVQFTKSFYTWYLQNFYRDHDFPHYENQNEVLGPWLTSDFLANWDQILAEIDMNPVLLTAEDPTAWGSQITAKLASQSIRTSVVYVTVGLGENLHAYNVTLIKSPDDTWKISGVASTN